MPSNWLVGYDDRLAKQLYEAAITKTEHMCQEILAGRNRTLHIHPVLGVIARGIHIGEDLGARAFGKELHTSDACTGCGQCVKLCPTGNIRREDGRIRFGWDCMWCMRCIYACPQRAISPRFSKPFVLRKGYDIRAIVADPGLEGRFVNEETRGYFGRFLGYLGDVAL
jgi:ferredoxin